VVFVWRELRAEKPMVDLRLFAIRNFSVATVLIFLTCVLIYSIGLLTPQFLQLLLGYSSLASGIATAPLGLGAVISMVLVGVMVRKIDGRLIIIFGFLVLAAASFRLSQVNLSINAWTVFWPQILAGSAMGFLFVPVNILGTAPLRRDQIGSATGALSLMRNVGGSVGIAWVSTLLARRSQVHQIMLGQNLTPDNLLLLQNLRGIRRFLSMECASFGNGAPQALAAVYRILQQQAALMAFTDVFQDLVLVALGAILLVALLHGAAPRPGAPLH
jgi:DHA2 family multidrug resistance protein